MMETRLDEIMQLGNLLRDSGLTLGWLALITLLFAVTLVLSTRELLLWYLKINQLQGEVRDLKAAILRIERRQLESRQAEQTVAENVDQPEITLTVKPMTTSAQQFTLNH
ncbi:MAG: hypothetical protein AB7K41_15550 [Bdellovibrionales bacterium]